MKQTAVEKLIEQITPLIDRSKISDTMLHNLVEEHLAMEKQQLEDAWYAGDEDGAIHEFEQYYNETYKQAKEMEKENVFLFAKEYDEYLFRGCGLPRLTAEQYYNQTYKQD
jgi:hypothetical protein